MSLLLAAGAAPAHKKMDTGESPLFLAAAAGDLPMLRALVAAGASLDDANYLGQTPLWVAADMGRAETVAALASCGADVNLSLIHI